MFAAKRHGLLDALATALCVWVALFQTPVGALARAAKAKLFNEPTPTRSLLAYYRGGVWEAPVLKAQPQEWAAPMLLPSFPLTPVDLLTPATRAVTLVATRLLPEHQAALRRFSASHDEKSLERALKRAHTELGSEDAAVLAVFVGTEATQFAVHRARAEGRSLSLENLVPSLPHSARNGGDAASLALTLSTAYSLGPPLAAPFRVSSGFGYRRHPLTGQQQLHTGIDLAVPLGTSVRAAHGGIVTRASYDRLNGHLLIIDHGRGVTTAYCHNLRLLVGVGHKVAAGDTIAESGSTGRSTGPHLHYQLELGQRPVNPLLFQRLNDAQVSHQADQVKGLGYAALENDDTPHSHGGR